MTPKYLTVAEVGERLNYSRKTVNGWILSGMLPAARPPGSATNLAWRIREEDLDEFMVGGRFRVASVLLAHSADVDVVGGSWALYHEDGRFVLRRLSAPDEEELRHGHLQDWQYLKGEIARLFYRQADERLAPFPEG
jgi:excisionase family DNA binding protein